MLISDQNGIVSRDSHYSVNIPFVNQKSIKRLQEFESYLTQLRISKETHIIDNLINWLGWQKTNPHEYNLKSEDNFIKITGSINRSSSMKSYNKWGKQRGKPVDTCLEYPYHLETIRLFYKDLMSLSLPLLREKYKIDFDFSF